MPLYDFRCPKCGLEFEVSRPISRATDPALCPVDSQPGDRVFTMPMTFTRGGAARPPPAEGSGGSGWSHFGHSHGAAAGGHAHGATDTPAGFEQG